MSKHCWDEFKLRKISIRVNFKCWQSCENRTIFVSEVSCRREFDIRLNLQLFRSRYKRRMASTSTSNDSLIYTYKKLVVPVSMRSIYWKYFGFPASDKGEIITKLKIICILCKTQIAYNKNTSNLRMHLQNKHLAELIKIESQVALDENSKGKVIKKPVKLKQNVQIGVEESAEGCGEFYISDDSHQVFHLEPNEPQDNFIYTTVSKKMYSPVNVEESKSLTDAIANFIITDLESPQVVDGRGFQRLLVTLRSPCEIPSTIKLTTDLIPKMYKVTKENLQMEICNLTSSVGLAVEEWTTYSNQSYLTISVYYQSMTNAVVCKVLSTIHILPTMDSNAWEYIFDSILSEWNIDYGRITAVTFATTREEIVTALYNKEYTLIPCFEFTMKECVKQCFEIEGIGEIIVKVRSIISTILRNSHALEALTIYDSASEVEGNLQLETDTFWVSTLRMLEQFLAKKEIIENIWQDFIEFPLKNGLEMAENEWEILQDLTTVLEPFKVTLMTLSEEKVPLISLLKPLLWQVINNKLKEKESDSIILQSLKKTIVEDMLIRYNDEQISPLLHIATMLDPRFKLLPYSSEEEKASTAELIKGMLTKLIEEQEPQVEEPVAKKSRLSGMELLLGNYSSKKVKVDPTENANNEFNQFYTDATPPLDSCPVQWWGNNRGKYSNLSLLADKYICVPACAVLPGKISADSQNSFILKRAAFNLDPNLLDKVLFVHANQALV